MIKKVRSYERISMSLIAAVTAGALFTACAQTAAPAPSIIQREG